MGRKIPSEENLAFRLGKWLSNLRPEKRYEIAIL